MASDGGGEIARCTSGGARGAERPLTGARGIALSRILGILVLAASGCEMPTVDAGAPPYDPTALTAGVLYHWPLGTALAVHVVEGGTPNGQDIASAARTAAKRWSRAMGYREMTFRIVPTREAADILILDVASPIPVDTAGCGGPGWTEAAGRTRFCPAGDTARTLAFLSGPTGQVKVVVTIDVAATANASELLSVVVHELGHALGIGGHSDDADDVMFAVPRVTAPSGRDERTLRYVLHRHPGLTL
jgi:Zn-dependent protease with chaperone function